jgi:hypothetical protein
MEGRPPVFSEKILLNLGLTPEKATIILLAKDFIFHNVDLLLNVLFITIAPVFWSGILIPLYLSIILSVLWMSYKVLSIHHQGGVVFTVKLWILYLTGTGGLFSFFKDTDKYWKESTNED